MAQSSPSSIDPIVLDEHEFVAICTGLGERLWQSRGLRQLAKLHGRANDGLADQLGDVIRRVASQTRRKALLPTRSFTLIIGEQRISGVATAQRIDEAGEFGGSSIDALLDDQTAAALDTGRAQPVDQPLDLTAALHGDSGDLTAAAELIVVSLRFASAAVRQLRHVLDPHRQPMTRSQTSPDYHRVFAESPVPLLLLHVDGLVQESNDAFERFLGRHVRGLLNNVDRPDDSTAVDGGWWLRLMPSNLRQEYRDRLHKLASGLDVGPMRFTPDGSGRILEINGHVVRGDDAHFPTVCEAVLDVTDRDRGEVELIERLRTNEQLTLLARELADHDNLPQAARLLAKMLAETLLADLVVVDPSVRRDSNDALCQWSTPARPADPGATQQLVSSLCPLLRAVPASSVGKGRTLWRDQPAPDDPMLARLFRWMVDRQCHSLELHPLTLGTPSAGDRGIVGIARFSPPQRATLSELARIEAGQMIAIAEAGMRRIYLQELADANRQEELLHLATHDGLTGLLNRREIEHVLNVELLRVKRYRRELGVMLFDVDDFKQFNTQHGYLAGDEVLRHVADLARQVLRDTDRIGRLGGDEFLAIVPEASRAGMMTLAERLLVTIEATPTEQKLPPVHVSAGIVITGELTDLPPDARTMLAIADTALRDAKRTGKNQFAAWPPSPPTTDKPAEHP